MMDSSGPMPRPRFSGSRPIAGQYRRDGKVKLQWTTSGSPGEHCRGSHGVDIKPSAPESASRLQVAAESSERSLNSVVGSTGRVLLSPIITSHKNRKHAIVSS